jgi:hypothetical protein
MSNANCFPAKPAFGKMKPQLYAGDYIKNKAITVALQNKKTKYNTKLCNYMISGKKYCSRNKCNNRCCSNVDEVNIDYTKLNINLITKEDLKDVTVIETFPDGISPTTINPNITTPFYENYIIDPSGQLFGNTCCGINNFLLYRKLKFL